MQTIWPNYGMMWWRWWLNCDEGDDGRRRKRWRWRWNSDEDDDGTACKTCKIPWIELTEKCWDWVQCQTCDEYVYQKCCDKRDIPIDDDFFL